jgi:hypothetical protein
MFMAFIGDLEEGRGERRSRVMWRFFTPTCRPGRTVRDDLSSIRAYLLLSAGSVAATVLAIQVRDGVGLWGWLARALWHTMRGP